MAQQISCEAPPAGAAGISEVDIVYQHGDERKREEYRHKAHLVSACPSGIYYFNKVRAVKDGHERELGDTVIVALRDLYPPEFVHFESAGKSVVVTGAATDRSILDKLGGWLRVVAVDASGREWFDEKSVFVEYLLSGEASGNKIVGLVLATKTDLIHMYFSNYRFIRFELEKEESQNKPTRDQ